MANRNKKVLSNPKLKFSVYIGFAYSRLVLFSNSFVTVSSKKYLTGEIYSNHLIPTHMFLVLFVYPEKSIKGTNIAGATSTANEGD